MSLESSATIALIGIGSPYGDDQVGWRVVEAAQTQQLPVTDAVCCLVPMVDLLPLLACYDVVILVDAVAAENLPVGTVQCWSGTAIRQVNSVYSSHGFSLANVLALAESLGQLPRLLKLYGIVINPEHLATLPYLPLTPDIEAAIDATLTLLKQDEWLK